MVDLTHLEILLNNQLDLVVVEVEPVVVEPTRVGMYACLCVCVCVCRCGCVWQ